MLPDRNNQLSKTNNKSASSCKAQALKLLSTLVARTGPGGELAYQDVAAGLGVPHPVWRSPRQTTRSPPSRGRCPSSSSTPGYYLNLGPAPLPPLARDLARPMGGLPGCLLLAELSAIRTPPTTTWVLTSQLEYN